MRSLLRLGILLGIFILPAKTYALDAVEIISGRMKADLQEKDDDYIGIPLFVSFNFDAKPFFSKCKIEPAGDLDFVVEPFLNTIISPDSNVEAGSNCLIKYTYPLCQQVQPYIKFGGGALYMSQHTREQATQYNFLPQLGLGAHLFLKENFALSSEYRYRHLSNCSFQHPNKGIETRLILGGVMFYF